MIQDIDSSSDLFLALIIAFRFKFWLPLILLEAPRPFRTGQVANDHWPIAKYNIPKGYSGKYAGRRDGGNAAAACPL